MFATMLKKEIVTVQLVADLQNFENQKFKSELVANATFLTKFHLMRRTFFWWTLMSKIRWIRILRTHHHLLIFSSCFTKSLDTLIVFTFAVISRAFRFYSFPGMLGDVAVYFRQRIQRCRPLLCFVSFTLLPGLTKRSQDRSNQQH